MQLARALVLFSAAVLFAVGIGYLVVPGAMLAVVGIESGATADFLLRTEGVALASAAIVLWAVRGAGGTPMRLILGGLAVYYVLGSLVDLAAFMHGDVGAVSVPSVGARVAVGVLCVLVAVRLSPSAAPR